MKERLTTTKASQNALTNLEGSFKKLEVFLVGHTTTNVHVFLEA